jgi:putative FmdB family regulatory protein
MPMYEYGCAKCEVVAEEIRDVEKRNDPLTCPECGGEMKREFAATTFVRIVDSKKWKDTVTGAISTKKRRRVLGTDIGRVRIDKLGNELTALDDKYRTPVAPEIPKPRPTGRRR